jgi:hypothetical protein
MRIKKGDKLTLVGLEKDTSKNISKMIFETAGGNRIVFSADGEKYQYHYIAVSQITEKKFEEEMEIT